MKIEGEKEGDVEDKEFSPTPENLFELCQQFSNKLREARRFNHQDREDFAQDLYIVLERAVERFDPKRGVPLRAFLWRRAQGYLLDWYRRIKPEDLIWIDEDDSSEKEQQFFGRSYQDHELIFLDDLAKKLEPKRRFVYLCLARGYKPSEIARMMEVTESRISRLMIDIRRKLRQENERFLLNVVTD